MVAKIRYSKSAIRDLEEIGDYIADTLKSPIAALCTVEKILVLRYIGGRI